MPQVIDPIAQQTGFGLAANVVLTTLLDNLADKGIFSRDELKELLEWALLNLETNQEFAPSSDIVVAARLLVEALIYASETKRRRFENRPPPRTELI